MKSGTELCCTIVQLNPRRVPHEGPDDNDSAVSHQLLVAGETVHLNNTPSHMDLLGDPTTCSIDDCVLISEAESVQGETHSRRQTTVRPGKCLAGAKHVDGSVGRYYRSIVLTREGFSSCGFTWFLCSGRTVKTSAEQCWQELCGRHSEDV
jgi:hypothetical protein